MITATLWLALLFAVGAYAPAYEGWVFAMPLILWFALGVAMVGHWIYA